MGVGRGQGGGGEWREAVGRGVGPILSRELLRFPCQEVTNQICAADLAPWGPEGNGWAQRRAAPQGDSKDKAIGEKQQIPVILRVGVEMGPRTQLSGSATRVEKDRGRE